jgi:hypothetical protein
MPPYAPMPALATIVSSRPHFCTAAATRASLSFGSRTSPTTGTTRSSPSSPTILARRSSRRALTATRAPASTRSYTVAVPMPALAPVTATTAPSRDRVGE